jgi:hypothetical protein
LGRARLYSDTQVAVRSLGKTGREKVYRLEPRAEAGPFWKAAPLVLPSLLATYLPENKVGVDECWQASPADAWFWPAGGKPAAHLQARKWVAC